jgi:hypothetical protein
VTIGFLVWRKGYLKIVGSVIQAALKRAHRVVLFWDQKEAKL